MTNKLFYVNIKDILGEKMAGDIKNDKTIKENIIIGDSAIIFLAHKRDKNLVLNEINEHAQSGTFIQILEDVATKALVSTGLHSKRDTHKKGQGKNPVYQWSKTTNGGPRLYLDVSSHNGKPVYIIYVIGNKQSQDTDFLKAYHRRQQMLAEKIDIHAQIEETLKQIEENQPVLPKIIAHHYGRHSETRKKNKQKTKAS